MLFNQTCSPKPTNRDQNVFKRIENSPQYHDGKFQIPGGMLDMSFKDYATSTWDYFFSGNDLTPDSALPLQQVDPGFFNDPATNQLNVTWLGHSSLMVNIDGYKILVDPVFERRVSILGPTRFNGEVPLDIEQLSGIDIIIISHDHYDHLNKYSIQKLRNKTKLFIVPLGIGARLVKWGVAPERIVELDWWEEYAVDGKMLVAATPAQHFSGRGLSDRNKTLWASWVIKAPNHRVYFSGDSGYFNGFKQIGEKYGPFDMTFIECGAYNEMWYQVHMFPEETVQAHRDLKGKVLHPIHWGTFNLALHPWYEPMERLTAAADSGNVDAVTPIVGETTVYGRPPSTAKWWQPAMDKQKSQVKG